MAVLDKSLLKLYLVLETSMLKVPLADFIKQVLEGGVTAIQLRDKFSSPRARYETGLEIKKHFGSYSPLFIVNDAIDLALALCADGAHLGIKDIPIADARKIAPELIYGYSCNTFEDCRIACEYADYAGVGPVYPTQTKKDLRKILGIAGLRENLKGLDIPAICIGGITDENCGEAAASGVDGVALSSFICSSEHPYESVLSVMKKINERV